MNDPFDIEGPAVVSFSGGRTSAYMLSRILDRGLHPDVHVLFADTGQERRETYVFIERCGFYWNTKVHHVERPGQFTQLITDRKFLPNPVMRFCTQELKIRPMKVWMLARGYEHWTNVVGIRADEPRRVARMRGRDIPEQWDVALPLADAGVTLDEVDAFWRRQPFNLALRAHEGNCDLCFLKRGDQIRNLVRDRPDLAQWWIDQEARTGGFFRKDRPSYAAMSAQGDLFLGLDDKQVDCFCTD